MTLAAGVGGPQFDLFQPVSPETVRMMAAGAGDWSALVVREVGRVLDEEGGRRPEALARGIDELVSRDLVRSEEAGRLKEIVRAFYEVAHGKGDADAARATVLDHYGRLGLDPDGSPAAVAIASVAASAVTPVASPPATRSGDVALVEVTITPGSTGAGAVVGAVIGAAFGGLMGGWVGAGIGAAIGAVAGAAIGYSNEGEEA